METD
jgi:hypothetical protein